METEFKELCSGLRTSIAELGDDVLALNNHSVFMRIEAGTEELADPGEMRANIKLAYRHLEDARMRLGKVIQAFDGGQSVYKD